MPEGWIGPWGRGVICRSKCLSQPSGWGTKPLSIAAGNRCLQAISGSGPYSEAVRNYQNVQNKKITQSWKASHRLGNEGTLLIPVSWHTHHPISRKLWPLPSSGQHLRCPGPWCSVNPSFKQMVPLGSKKTTLMRNDILL